MTEFYYDILTKNVKISLNHKYKEYSVIFKIELDDWSKNYEKIDKIFRSKDIQEDDIEDIKNNLNDYWKQILESNIQNDENNTNESPRSDYLIRLFQESQSKLFKDEFDSPHALVKINDHYRVLPIRHTNFRRYLSKLHYENCDNRIPSIDTVRNVVNFLEAKAFFDGESIPLHLRTVWSNETKDTIYYDLSDEQNRFVKIATDGWTILGNQTNVLFRRYNHQRPQVEPIPLVAAGIDDVDGFDAVFDEFISILNIKNDSDKLLLKCYIISLFIPGIPQVILILLGEQGGAKTMFQELIRQLVDPSITGTLTFPSNPSEFIQQLSHHYLVYYDNVSYISNWISDLLCRAVTGNSASKRVLYTDDDDFYYNFKRKLGLNGIDLARINSDLSDRAITIKQERIDKSDRKKEVDIWTKFNELRPRLLSYIFHILAKVLEYKKNNPKITFPEGINRMADWEEYAEIISRCIGNKDGQLQHVYRENLGRQIEDAVASNQLCMAVIEYVNNHKEDQNSNWQEKTPTDLYEILTSIARYTLKLTNLNNKKYWPPSPNSLTHNLNLVKTVLREKEIGIITGIKNKDGKRVIKITSMAPVNAPKRPSTPSTSSNTTQSSIDQGKKIDGVDISNNRTSSIQTCQNQAQTTWFGRFDSFDDLFPSNTGCDEKNSDTVLIKMSSNKKNPTLEFTKEHYIKTLGGIEDYQIALSEDVQTIEHEYSYKIFDHSENGYNEENSYYDKFNGIDDEQEANNY